jgi:hypothetical protein
MKQCLSHNGSTVVIKHSEQLSWRTSPEDALAAVEERVRSEEPITGQQAVNETVTASSNHLDSPSAEHRLELPAVIEYPGCTDELPAEIAHVGLFETIVHRIASWEANRSTTSPTEA